jgi:hypothetical protein
MGNPLALIEFTKTLSYTCHEVDTFLDVFPSGIFREIFNAFDGYFFDRHSQTSSNVLLLNAYTLPAAIDRTKRRAAKELWETPTHVVRASA